MLLTVQSTVREICSTGGGVCNWTPYPCGIVLNKYFPKVLSLNLLLLYGSTGERHSWEYICVIFGINSCVCNCYSLKTSFFPHELNNFKAWPHTFPTVSFDHVPVAPGRSLRSMAASRTVRGLVWVKTTSEIGLCFKNSVPLLDLWAILDYKHWCEKITSLSKC